jgi:hypothetical protein
MAARHCLFFQHSMEMRIPCRAMALARLLLRKQRSATKKQRSIRALARVVKPCLGFFQLPTVLLLAISVMFSMGYDQKRHCHCTGRNGAEKMGNEDADVAGRNSGFTPNRQPTR